MSKIVIYLCADEYVYPKEFTETFDVAMSVEEFMYLKMKSLTTETKHLCSQWSPAEDMYHITFCSNGRVLYRGVITCVSFEECLLATVD